MPQASTLAETSPTALYRWVFRCVILAVLAAVCGCAHVPLEDPPQAEAAPAPAPLPSPAPPAASVLLPPDAPPGRPLQEPAVERISEFPGTVAIVLSDRSPAYENVALELGELLDDFVIYNLADRSLDPQAAFSGIADSTASVVIAIGLRAAQQAIALSTVPVVFCQVFNMDITDAAVPVKGVAAIPPLSLQVRAWKRLDPTLQDIGAILGEGHEDLIAEAQQATAEHGITLHYRIVASDRETLYIFNRMAPEIDGFWLFPDNRVLSVPVLREMLSYASRHQVRVAAFNTSLLTMGAALSATAVEADIAATVVSVAHRIVHGDVDSLPPVSPLHEVDIRTAGATPSGPIAAKGLR